MLTPKDPAPPSQPDERLISVRLTGTQAGHFQWLIARLNMTKTELIKALVEQEYQDQGGE